MTTDPDELCCSISGSLFEDPVVAEDGHTYEKEFIERWFEQQRPMPILSPLTKTRLEKAGHKMKAPTKRKDMRHF